MAILTAPVVEWYNVDRVNPINTNTSVIAQPYDFGIVDAGYIPTPNDYYSFLIWNNRDTMDRAPQMEDVTIGVKDMSGGNGSTVGQEVWAINGNVKWFWAYVDSIGETDANFAQIGATLTKPIGTNGTTTHPDVANAITWSASQSKSVGDVVQPAVDNGFIYKAVAGGTTDTAQPTWSTVQGDIVVDGGVQYEAIQKSNTPSANSIILGGENDGTLANASGNFARITMKVEVPLSAQSGRQDFKLRTSYRYV